jgi:integrase/recombinase XerD
VPHGSPIHKISDTLQKTDIRIIQVLLGHKKLDTTALYTRVAINTIGQVTSPLDFLRKMPG